MSKSECYWIGWLIGVGMGVCLTFFQFTIRGLI
jgi:hypothetical protein